MFHGYRMGQRENMVIAAARGGIISEISGFRFTRSNNDKLRREWLSTGANGGGLLWEAIRNYAIENLIGV